MSPPPIPARLADRPTVGGLVVPYISVSSGDRHILGSTHNRKRNECLIGRRCQTDGEPLGRRAVVLCTTTQLGRQWTQEPAMHPECAAYSIAACPMVNGQMASYRTGPPPVDRLPCTEPGCNCGGWINETKGERDLGPVEPWHQVWLAAYDLAADPGGKLIGLSWANHPPLRVRPVAQLREAVDA